MDYGSNALSVIYKNNFLKNITEDNKVLIGSSGRITYFVHHENWAVASGFDKNGHIFYVKYLRGQEQQMMKMILTYSPQLKALYNPIILKIAACFKGV